jgi:ferredoxin
MVDKKVIIDNEKCVRCGKCIAECPRNLLNFIDSKTNPEYFVGCSNKEKALTVKRVCSKGCIGCTLCTKVESSPYFMKDNLSCVDYKNATDLNSLEEGKNKCPTKCIYSLETSKVAAKNA